MTLPCENQQIHRVGMYARDMASAGQLGLVQKRARHHCSVHSCLRSNGLHACGDVRASILLAIHVPYDIGPTATQKGTTQQNKNNNPN